MEFEFFIGFYGSFMVFRRLSKCTQFILQDCDKIMLQLCSLSALVLIATTGHAYAYIDPGVGSILLQSLIALIAAASVTLGYYWQRIKGFFKSGDNVSKSTKGQAEDQD